MLVFIGLVIVDIAMTTVNVPAGAYAILGLLALIND